MTNEAIYGNMGSEKTHEFLRRIIMWRNSGSIPQPVVFRIAGDRQLRPGEPVDVVTSRTGLSYPAKRVWDADEAIAYININSPPGQRRVFGIPDIHLYGTKGAKFISLAEENQKDPDRLIIVEGLDKDYTGKLFEFGNSEKTVFGLYGYCVSTHMIGKCFYTNQDGKKCMKDALFSLRLVNGMPCPTNLPDIPLISPGSELPNGILYKGADIFQNWLGVCDKHHVVGSADEIAEQVIKQNLNFPQPIEGLESLVGATDLRFFKKRCSIWLPNDDFLAASYAKTQHPA